MVFLIKCLTIHFSSLYVLQLVADLIQFFCLSFVYVIRLSAAKQQHQRPNKEKHFPQIHNLSILTLHSTLISQVWLCYYSMSRTFLTQIVQSKITPKINGFSGPFLRHLLCCMLVTLGALAFHLGQKKGQQCLILPEVYSVFYF